MRVLLNWLFAAVTGILLGGIVHIGSLLAIPHFSNHNAYGRLVSISDTNNFIVLDPEKGDRRLPLLDPTFINLTCRYDVTKAPLQIRVPIVSDYLALSFYGRDGIAFFSLNEQSALGPNIDVELYDASQPDLKTEDLRAGTIPIAAPSAEGFVFLRVFAPTPSIKAVVQPALSQAVCEPARPR
ncbi:DUF1254 domain-containing protein [Terrihabitans sp. B22-R8]|uniref:DUF1254 domain-containing protein n=1 Tax=Terrihabitans sp. B22-R8 TaxID=3425128 RepID=UPI00403D15D5